MGGNNGNECHEIGTGRFFTAYEDFAAKNVCVIGADICSNLFGEDSETGKPINAIGKVININYVPFSVIGVQKMETEAKEKAVAQLKKSLNQSGPKRTSRFGSRRGGRFSHRNNTVHIPLNTMWMKLRCHHRVLHQVPFEADSRLSFRT